MTEKVGQIWRGVDPDTFVPSVSVVYVDESGRYVRREDISPRELETRPDLSEALAEADKQRTNSEAEFVRIRQSYIKRGVVCTFCDPETMEKYQVRRLRENDYIVEKAH